MFYQNRFTERARQALTLAQEAAGSFGHSYIGSEHLLLGLLREGGGPAAKALAAAGVTDEALVKQIEELSGRGTPDATAPQGMTPRTKRIIELSVQSANEMGTGYVGTEHLLLGILREGQNVGLTALANLRVTPEILVRKLNEALGGVQDSVSGEPGTAANGGADSKLYMELTITKGRGYISADKGKSDDMPIGVLAVDAIYTPVERVNLKVENTRVGQITDYDKLTLDVYTRGTLDPDEAVSLAAKVLSEHLKLFIDLSENAKTAEVMIEKEDNEKEKVLEMNIDELELSVRSYNCLKRAGINTVEELCNKTSEDMMKVRNLGRKSLEEVLAKLKELGLSLSPGDGE